TAKLCRCVHRERLTPVQKKGLLTSYFVPRAACPPRSSATAVPTRCEILPGTASAASGRENFATRRRGTDLAASRKARHVSRYFQYLPVKAKTETLSRPASFSPANSRWSGSEA